MALTSHCGFAPVQVAIYGRAEEVRKLKAAGLGLRAIARQLGMPPSSVHKALQLAA